MGSERHPRPPSPSGRRRRLPLPPLSAAPRSHARLCYLRAPPPLPPLGHLQPLRRLPAAACHQWLLQGPEPPLPPQGDEGNGSQSPGPPAAPPRATFAPRAAASAAAPTAGLMAAASRRASARSSPRGAQEESRYGGAAWRCGNRLRCFLLRLLRLQPRLHRKTDSRGRVSNHYSATPS